MRASHAENKQQDVVIASYTLSELPSDSARATAVALLWRLVSEKGGILVLVERGNPFGSHIVRSAREMILENCNEIKVKGHVLAPCMHDKKCPLKEGEWCSFGQRVPRVEDHKLGKQFTEESFSYIILRKGPDNITSKHEVNVKRFIYPYHPCYYCYCYYYFFSQ